TPRIVRVAALQAAAALGDAEALPAAFALATEMAKESNPPSPGLEVQAPLERLVQAGVPAADLLPPTLAARIASPAAPRARPRPRRRRRARRGRGPLPPSGGARRRPAPPRRLPGPRPRSAPRGPRRRRPRAATRRADGDRARPRRRRLEGDAPPPRGGPRAHP